MEATKATIAIANGLMDKKRLDDIAKIGGKPKTLLGRLFKEIFKDQLLVQLVLYLLELMF